MSWPQVCVEGGRRWEGKVYRCVWEGQLTGRGMLCKEEGKVRQREERRREEERRR